MGEALRRGGLKAAGLPVFSDICVALGMAQHDYHSANKTILFHCQSGYGSSTFCGLYLTAPAVTPWSSTTQEASDGYVIRNNKYHQSKVSKGLF